VELALGLHREARLPPTTIDSIVVRGGPVQSMLATPLERKQAPATPIDAKFSLPFTVATALVHGKVDLDSFAPEALQDAAVLELAARVCFEPEPHWGADRATSAKLLVRSRDGRELCGELLEPRGSPARPLDDAELTDKFVTCAGRAAETWPEHKARSAAARLLTLGDGTRLAGPLDAWLSTV
jgi:2-methylcitrate dehydratase PrpD